jgi:hypothetical protein
MKSKFGIVLLYSITGTHKALDSLGCILSSISYRSFQRKKRKEPAGSIPSFISKINTTNRNFQMLPPNATVRYEYVKCGKSNCIKCSEKDYHGGYYYAYFRHKENQGKLKKKYIGFFDPRDPYVRGFDTHLLNQIDI